MPSRGFTLIEVVFAASILAVGICVLFGVSLKLDNTARELTAQSLAYQDGRRALDGILKEVRQATGASLSVVPGPVLEYRIPADLDGNGLALDAGGNVELSGVHVIGRDYEDANADGLAHTQLVLLGGDRVQVLANGLVPDEDINDNGVLDPGEDENANGRLDRGVWFEPAGSGVRVTVQVVRRSRGGNMGHSFVANLNQVIIPRN